MKDESYYHVDLVVNGSPKGHDIAFTSVDSAGTPGQLNRFVLKELGYSIDDIPKDFSDGFAVLEKKNLPLVVFIVSIDRKNGSSDIVITENIRLFLRLYKGSYEDFNVWIPLLGTGTARLNPLKSWESIYRAISKTKFKRLTISLPDSIASSEKNEIESHIQNWNESYGDDNELDNKIKNAVNFWFINDRYKWLNEFLGEGRDFFVEISHNSDIIEDDLAFCFDAEQQQIRGIAQFYEPEKEAQRLKLLQLFNPPIDISDLKKIKYFSKEIGDLLNEDSFRISQGLFLEILRFTGLDRFLGKESTGGEKDKLFDLFPVNNPSKIPQNRNDQATGKDYLGIDKDVTAFAKIIASNSFNPPLAIALFGRWGSGKSFFMNKLQERIDKLTETNTEVYSGGIVHIQFNAWSYVDANLWASIVSRIFDGLNLYINDETSVAKENKVEVERELSKKLKVLGEERKVLQSQKESLEEKVNSLKALKTTAQKDIDEKLQEIKSRKLIDVLQEIDREFNVLDRVSGKNLNSKDRGALNRLKSIIPKEYWTDPQKAIYQANSITTFLASFFKKDRMWWNIWVSLLIVLIVLGVPVLLDLIDTFDLEPFQLIPQVVITAIGVFIPVWKRIESNYKLIRPVVNKLWLIKKEYDDEREGAISKFHQDLESIKFEIELKEREIGVYDEQILTIEAEISGLDIRLRTFLSTHSLYSFIEKRAKGDIYKKHLGIISTIRSDFEILSEMFVESKDEQQHEAFRKYFKKRLQRIILYIDDLDRCPEDRVIEVLEAVNLIMAFPLFVVVVGVDHRWVSNALIKQHHFQFKGSGDSNGYQKIEASDYLEKIFQIPFHLYQPEEKSVRNMIKNLSEPRSKRVKELAERLKETIQEVTSDQSDTINSEFEELGPKLTESEEKQPDDHELLELSDSELEIIQDMAGLIGSNPRAIKRFVNTYHIVRAHEGLSVTTNKEQQYTLIMFLLVMSMGPYRNILSYINRLNDPKMDETKQINEIISKEWDLKDLMNIDKVDEPLRSQLYALKVDIKKMRKYIDGKEKLNLILNSSIKELKKQNEFIRRFTFQHSS